MKRIKLSIVVTMLLMLSLGLTGCANQVKRQSIEDADIVSLSYVAADKLIAQADDAINEKGIIVAASFVNINNLDASSSFGRIASQQLSSRFTQKGYKVTEMLLRSDIYIKERNGEFMLSRAFKNISAEHNAQAVIIGTYAVASKNVYVTAKIVRTRDNAVLSSHDYTLPLGPDMKSLVRN